MNKTTSLTVAAAAALAFTLSACNGGESDDKGGAPTAKATTTAATPAPEVEPSITASRQRETEQAAGLPPAPAAEDALDYVQRLRQIDADLVTGASSEAVVNRGRDQCATIYAVDDKAYQRTAANVRFATVNHPRGFGDKADDINEAIKKYICPKAWN